MDALHELENEVMQFVCVENLAYDLKRICCTHDSNTQATFSEGWLIDMINNKTKQHGFEFLIYRK